MRGVLQTGRTPRSILQGSDPHAARGYREGANIPTAGGKVARTSAEARRKAKEARREYAQAYRARKRRAASGAAKRRS